MVGISHSRVTALCRLSLVSVSVAGSGGSGGIGVCLRGGGGGGGHLVASVEIVYVVGGAHVVSGERGQRVAEGEGREGGSAACALQRDG